MISHAMDRIAERHNLEDQNLMNQTLKAPVVPISAAKQSPDSAALLETQSGSGAGARAFERARRAGAHAAAGEITRRDLRASRSNLVETIRQHGWALAPRDLALLETVVVNGQPSRPSCVMLGISESTGRRRVRMLTARLRSFAFQFVAQHATRWSQRETLVARCCVMQGLSINAAAAQLKLKPGAVRQARTRILARIEGAREMAQLLR